MSASWDVLASGGPVCGWPDVASPTRPLTHAYIHTVAPSQQQKTAYIYIHTLMFLVALFRQGVRPTGVAAACASIAKPECEDEHPSNPWPSPPCFLCACLDGELCVVDGVALRIVWVACRLPCNCRRRHVRPTSVKMSRQAVVISPSSTVIPLIACCYVSICLC